MIEGVRVLELAVHADARGAFTEVFRTSWDVGFAPTQWNVVSSRAGVLRGFHVHDRHTDFLTVAQGALELGLIDLRPGSPTHGVRWMQQLKVGDAVVLPPGVGHGFCFPEDAIHVYSVDEEFDGSDEFGCHPLDPELGLTWSVAQPELSERDSAAAPFATLSWPSRSA